MRCVIVSLFLAFAITASAQVDHSSAPDRLASKGARAPFWVSVNAAVDANGNFRADVIGTAQRTVLQNEAERLRRNRNTAVDAVQNDAPCPQRTISPHRLRNSRPSRSFSDVAGNSAAVYHGRIVAAIPGFQLSTPRTLLVMQVEQIVHPAAGFPDRGLIYVLYGGVDIRVGADRFCSAGSHGSFVPAVGDGLLLFAYEPPSDSSGRFLQTEDTHVFFSRNGRVIPPAAFEKDPDLPAQLSFETLEAAAGRKKAELQAKERTQ